MTVYLVGGAGQGGAGTGVSHGFGERVGVAQY